MSAGPYVITAQSAFLRAPIASGEYEGIPVGLLMALQGDILQGAETADSIRERGWRFDPEGASCH